MSQSFLLLAGMLMPVWHQTFDVYPKKIDIKPGQDRQTIVVTRTEADGVTREFTHESMCATEPAGLLRIENGIAYGARNGNGKLVIKVGGKNIDVPCNVQGFGVSNPVSYNRDILPILTRASCNGGKCHGAAAGKDGFRLSLFGFDPKGDHYRIVEEMVNRRVNFDRPADSLLITKSLGEVPHTGGKLMEKGSEFHNLLIRWISEGAQLDPPGQPEPLSITVSPPSLVLETNIKQQVLNNTKNSLPNHPGQRLSVTANYSDGSSRDVTHLCAFYSSNDGAATVQPNGFVNPAQRGEALILARFATFTAGTPVIVRPSSSKFVFPAVKANNYIDELVYSRLAKLHVAPSEVCSDEVFLRRASIDLVGKLPEPDELKAFVLDKDPEKRNKAIDRLIARPEFDDIWTMRWSEILQIRTANGASPKGIGRYHDWLRAQVRAGRPIDQIVREVLCTTGGTFEKPAANYYQTETTPTLLGENIAQVLLGMRIQCAQCHNHPFDRWTMDDYYGFTAFFAQIGYKQAPDPREITVFNRGEGEMEHPLTSKSITPRFLGGGEPQKLDKDRREVLADWIVSKDNPYFSRNLANVIWAHFLGQGIVDQVDDVRISNPPSNPELFNTLGLKFASYNYDARKLARDICQSKTYQLSTVKNESNRLDTRNFASASIRRIRAEVLLDCLSQATGAPTKFQGKPSGSRAVELLDGRDTNYFLSTFGRSTRETPCACEVKVEPTLSQALHMLNGENTTAKISQGKRIDKFLAESKSAIGAAEQIYLVCLGRYPTPKEKEQIQQMLTKAKDQKGELEDLFWAVLNSREFLFNH
jgi:hypothetical protein